MLRRGRAGPSGGGRKAPSKGNGESVPLGKDLWEFSVPSFVRPSRVSLEQPSVLSQSAQSLQQGDCLRGWLLSWAVTQPVTG